MKMAQQYWINRGEAQRSKFVAFKGGYHGDTLGAMAVSDPDSGFHEGLRGLLPEHVIADLPADAESGDALELVLARHADSIAALVVEPLVQGAGGMRFHDPLTLQRLREIADRCGALLIFDEIFTGFGRTGSMFASEQAGVHADIVTLSKALTGGTLPLAATVASRNVFEAFWSDDPQKALMHGPTYMGNALGCAAANASLDLFEREPRLAQVNAISEQMERELTPCRDRPGVKDVRVKGAIGVVELKCIADIQSLRAQFLEEGVFIRPFGAIIYLTPSFTIEPHELAQLTSAIVKIVDQGAGNPK
jgi:adenosylmethionine-8-amino-7-oxononanoate aminotransferase